MIEFLDLVTFAVSTALMVVGLMFIAALALMLVAGYWR